MAKSGEAADPAEAAKAEELRRELRRLLREIADDDRCGLEAFDRASLAVESLKRLRFRTQKAEPVAVPPGFLCPISAQLMTDPVVVASGLTYERRFIQKWFEDGHLTCPKTNQVLSHAFLTPNVLVRNMIVEWCDKNGMDLPSPIEERNEEGITQNERALLSSLLQKIQSSSVVDRKEGVKELRSLTKRVRSFRALIGETPNAIQTLLMLLAESGDDSGIQEDVVTTILNLSIHEDNKKIVADIPNAIPVIMEAVRRGSMETRSNAAKTLFSLAALDSNKTKIGELGAIEPLVTLVGEGEVLAKKDAASAIYNLCTLNENRGRAVAAGAVSVFIKMINEGLVVDEMITLLAILISEERGLDEMVKNGAVPFLLKATRERKSERSKENAVAVLCSICSCDRSKLKEVKKDEDVHGSLLQLAQTGNARARRKASSILEILKKPIESSFLALYVPQLSA